MDSRSLFLSKTAVIAHEESGPVVAKLGFCNCLATKYPFFDTQVTHEKWFCGLQAF